MKRLSINHFSPMSYAGAEAVNMLCTNLSFSGENVKVIMVTSCHASEGKSYLSMNIMRTMAKLGRRVVMVDCDLRRSSIIEHYGIRFSGSPEPAGLSHLLAGMAEESDVIYETDIPGAYLVPAGRNVTNSLPLLNSARFRALMCSLGEQFDYVIIDCPAGVDLGFRVAVAGADRAIIVTHNDAICQRDVERVKGLLQRADVSNMVLLVNRVTPEKLKKKQPSSCAVMAEKLEMKLIGNIEARAVVREAAEKGRPVVLEDEELEQAFDEIARRVMGEEIPVQPVRELGFWARLLKG